MININGQSFSGRNIIISNGKITIDGKKVDCDDTEISIEVHGSIDSIQADTCNTIAISGDVNGDVKTMSGDVHCNGVGGSVKTMSGDVRTKVLHGNAKTMSGDITR